MNKIIDQRVCMKLKLVHESGDTLYPVRMKNTDTGVVAFRLAPGGNSKQGSIEIEDKQSMLDYVLKKKYSVRASSLTAMTGSTKKRRGLYRLGQKSITRYELI
jgi:hypothetical protein